MATIKNLYGASGQAVTITLTSLASAAARESAAVDNSTNLFLDVLLTIKSKTVTGTIGGDRCLYVYAYGSVDGGTTYSDAATGTDAAVTLNSPTQLRLVGVLNVPLSNTAYEGGVWSVAAAFGGVLPQFWGVVVVNSTGLALSATAGDHAVTYQGVQAQSV